MFLNTALDIHHLYVILPVLIAILILLQRYQTHRQAHSNGCQPCPHYPHRDPFGLDVVIQNAKAFKAAQILPNMLASFDRFGNTWQRNFLFTPLIMTRDPANIQAVLLAKDEDWGVQDERNKIWTPVFGKQSLFTSDGHVWSYSRTLIKPAINATEYRNFDKFEEHFQSLLKLVPQEDGKSFNMGHVLENFMAAFGLDYFFGSENLSAVAIEHDPAAKKVIKAFDEGLIEMIRRTVLGKLAIFSPPTKQFKEHCATIERFVDEQVSLSKAYVEKADKQGKSKRKHVLIDEVVRMGHDREFQQGFLRTLFIGGTDTTQVLLANMTWMLARHPDVVKRLKMEVSQAFPNGVRPDLEGLKKIAYIKAIINETFRLHPVTPITNRIARKATTLPTGGGPHGTSPIAIAKGTRVFLATFAVHRDSLIWGSDAHEFKPERWLPLLSGEHKQVPYTFLPFSAGVRVCPGMQLAMANAMYYVARFAQVFECVEARDEREWRDELKITCPNANGVHIAVRWAEMEMEMEKMGGEVVGCRQMEEKEQVVDGNGDVYVDVDGDDDE